VAELVETVVPLDKSIPQEKLVALDILARDHWMRRSWMRKWRRTGSDDRRWSALRSQADSRRFRQASIWWYVGGINDRKLHSTHRRSKVPCETLRRENAAARLHHAVYLRGSRESGGVNVCRSAELRSYW